ncbi:CDP-diacylglycerol--glycerol-3-phosphate 3-phosphatidyltransferase [Mycolicibacterium iranicum]|uniref:CDP-diacylglycerol--glycerol-3-phosphate 3-phosphatidyltransferase n=1 Tax=Mycolicibacterium iranicum TaxID=912594 RepID=A0A839Q842_MYCIR|nr:CDP-alcohol phosphatidyltransferase family protein [Mycolicibacterium iranicum]MBB2991673.1 CDP-diacylglycerol--glycerol-3-phosphate 3-phosphatidyltransferase [Mycolicibacterium iranicum]
MNAPVATRSLTPSTNTRSRMTGLYALKPWFTSRLTPIVDAAVARRISPDVFTVVGVLGGGAAGVTLAFGWWPLAAVFMVLRLAGANLDGAVARARGVSRPWGFVVNEIGDRTADLLAFSGLAVWAARQGGPGLDWLSWPVLQVLLAALAATLPTFASLAAAGAGATRRNGGPLGKTERCVFVVLAVAIPVLMPVLLMQLLNGSVLTTVLRLRAARRELAAQRTARPATRPVRPQPARRVVAERLDAVTQPIDMVTQPLYALGREAVTRPMVGAAA